MNIVVTGSTGNISKPLAERLIANGHAVTIISSNPQKQREVEALGAKAAIGTLEDGDFVTATFKEADAVYCMIPLNFAAQDQAAYYQTVADNFVKAIKSAGVKKAVFLTGWAADLLSSHDMTATLDQLSDIAIAELRPGSFYTNFYSYIGMIKEQGVMMSNYGDEDRLAFVSPEDIAVAAFEELTLPFDGKKIRYVASEELTCNEAAHILGEAIGKPDLKWITISSEQMLQAFLGMGMPEQLAGDLVAMQAATHSGAIYENYLKHRPVLGATKLKDFAPEFAMAYHQ